MAGVGRLEKLDNLRAVWPHEERDFTPWLAEEQNLSLLAETLGLDGLELVGREVGVGGYFADILARETGPEGGLVLIENMFGKSDHDHLGKLITYAAGLDARTVVLIAEVLREEHRAALDWLNGITGDGNGFFACQLELWRIGDSTPAPRFNVVAQPNGWAKETRREARADLAGEPSELKQTYQRYWEEFAKHLSKQTKRLPVRKAQPRQWLDFAVGESKACLRLEISSTQGRVKIGLMLNGPSAKNRFDAIEKFRDEIDSEYGEDLIWDRLPSKEATRIGLVLEGADPTDESDWTRQHQWLAAKLIKLDQVFRQRLQRLSYSWMEKDQE